MRLLLLAPLLSLAASQADIDAIAKQLRAKAISSRVNACKAAGALGADAKPLLRDLCNLSLAKDTQSAALEAISLIDAELFPLATALAVDRTYSARQAAIFGKEGKGGLIRRKDHGVVALPLIFSFARIPATDSINGNIRDVLRYIEEAKPDDPLVAEFLAECFKKKDGAGPAFKAAGVLAEAKVLRKELLPLVKAQLGSDDPGAREAAAAAAGSFGADAKELIPALKKLQIDKYQGVRSAATKSLAQIEAAPPP